MKPILDSSPKLFLVPKLFRNFPIRNSFPTLTSYGLFIRTLPFGRIYDDRVIGYYFLTMGAGNLVIHILSSLANANEPLYFKLFVRHCAFNCIGNSLFSNRVDFQRN